MSAARLPTDDARALYRREKAARQERDERRNAAAMDEARRRFVEMTEAATPVWKSNPNRRRTMRALDTRQPPRHGEGG